MSELTDKIEAGPVPDDLLPTMGVDYWVMSKADDDKTFVPNEPGIESHVVLGPLLANPIESMQWGTLKVNEFPAFLGGLPTYQSLTDFAIHLVKENAELKRLNLALSERVELQSQLLSRKAEK